MNQEIDRWVFFKEQWHHIIFGKTETYVDGEIVKFTEHFKETK